MPRKKTYRHICGRPSITYFKPAGVPLRDITDTELTLDEYESIRLADYEGLYQEEAAKLMNISRQTFGRIISSAHQKIAQALINGNAIAIKDKPDE